LGQAVGLLIADQQWPIFSLPNYAMLGVCDNWPRDARKAVRVVEQLIEMKRAGFPIANRYKELEVMIPYFRNPDALRVATQSHVACEQRMLCSALTFMQIQANGDVTTCCSKAPVGNIKTAGIREIWQNRPRWWETGCCLESRCSEEEKKNAALLT
jgi:iron-sulfur cluster protein